MIDGILQPATWLWLYQQRTLYGRWEDHLKKTCDSLPPIPSTSWVRYQFSPPNPFSEQATRYTGQLNVRFMIQARQLRHDHADAHYAAAIFRYQRERSIKLRDVAALACVDDKH